MHSGANLPTRMRAEQVLRSSLRGEGAKGHTEQPPTWASAPGRQAPTISGFDNQWGLMPQS